MSSVEYTPHLRTARHLSATQQHLDPLRALRPTHITLHSQIRSPSVNDQTLEREGLFYSQLRDQFHTQALLVRAFLRALCYASIIR